MRSYMVASRQLSASINDSLMSGMMSTTLVEEYGINKVEFIDFIKVIDINMEDHANRLFDLYDEDKSGYIDFRELIACLSVVSKGSFEEKLRLIFDIYDIDGSGYLTSDEIKLILEKTL